MEHKFTKPENRNEGRPEKPKPVKVKRYRTKSGQDEHLPKLGFVVNDKMLQKPFVIKAIENWEARHGKQAFGTVIVLD